MRPKEAQFLFVKAWCARCGSMQWHVKKFHYNFRCLGCFNKRITIGEPVQSPVE